MKVNYIIANTVDMECSMVWSTLEQILSAVENPGAQSELPQCIRLNRLYKNVSFNNDLD